jgi:hypothetical protein
VRRFNQLLVGDLRGMDESSVMYNREITAIFPAALLAEMETLFERIEYPWNRQHLSQGDIKSLIRYSNLNFSQFHSERLMEIMKLLIKNKGKRIVK